jgi:hypothetical protein
MSSVQWDKTPACDFQHQFSTTFALKNEAIHDVNQCTNCPIQYFDDEKLFSFIVKILNCWGWADVLVTLTSTCNKKLAANTITFRHNSHVSHEYAKWVLNPENANNSSASMNVSRFVTVWSQLQQKSYYVAHTVGNV